MGECDALEGNGLVAAEARQTAGRHTGRGCQYIGGHGCRYRKESAHAILLGKNLLVLGEGMLEGRHKYISKRTGGSRRRSREPSRESGKSCQLASDDPFPGFVGFIGRWKRDKGNPWTPRA
jgi:hypothetical protein